MDFYLLDVTSIIGWSLALASTITAWPQAIKLARTRNTSGVDLRSVSLAALTMVAWSVYTLRIEDLPALASSLGPLTAWCATLFFLIWCKVKRAKLSAFILIFLSVIIVAISYSSLWWVVGTSAALGSACWALPQLRTAFVAEDLKGVSVSTYAALAVENLGWIIYAFLTSTPAYAVGSSVQAPATAIIALKAFRSRRSV